LTLFTFNYLLILDRFLMLLVRRENSGSPRIKMTLRTLWGGYGVNTLPASRRTKGVFQDFDDTGVEVGCRWYGHESCCHTPSFIDFEKRGVILIAFLEVDDVRHLIRFCFSLPLGHCRILHICLFSCTSGMEIFERFDLLLVFTIFMYEELRWNEVSICEERYAVSCSLYYAGWCYV